MLACKYPTIRILLLLLLLFVEAGENVYAQDNAVVAEARRMLAQPINPVTNKTVSFSGNPHNYESLGLYFWPDSTDLSAPYIYKDCMPNPECKLYDLERINQFSYRARTISQAYLLTHDAAFSTRFEQELLAWFVNKPTRMNPNFEYAQIRRNADGNRGHSYGIIEAYVFTSVVETILNMREQNALSKKAYKKIRKWFGEFADWLRESENGQQQAKAANNLSLAYDVMMCEFYYFTGDKQRFDSLTTSFIENRLNKQFAVDGSQPEELKRAKPMSYCIYNLEHVLDFCRLQQRRGNTIYYDNKERIDAALQFIEKRVNNKKLLNAAEQADQATLQRKYNALKSGFKQID